VLSDAKTLVKVLAHSWFNSYAPELVPMVYYRVRNVKTENKVYTYKYT